MVSPQALRAFIILASAPATVAAKSSEKVSCHFVRLISCTFPLIPPPGGHFVTRRLLLSSHPPLPPFHLIPRQPRPIREVSWKPASRGSTGALPLSACGVLMCQCVSARARQSTCAAAAACLRASDAGRADGGKAELRALLAKWECVLERGREGAGVWCVCVLGREGDREAVCPTLQTGLLGGGGKD